METRRGEPRSAGRLSKIIIRRPVSESIHLEIPAQKSIAGTVRRAAACSQSIFSPRPAGGDSCPRRGELPPQFPSSAACLDRVSLRNESRDLIGYRSEKKFNTERGG